jgi:hypothetical protein
MGKVLHASQAKTESAMSTSVTTPSRLPLREPVPPLRAGDRLTAPEFERRFDARPDLKMAEPIEYRRQDFREYAVWRVEDGAFVSQLCQSAATPTSE